MYDQDGNSTKYTSTSFPGIPDKYAEQFAAAGEANIPFTVNHPTIDIKTSPKWNSTDPDTEWNDYKTMERTDYEEGGDDTFKSMFDPCPPGWRVPIATA